MKVQSDGILPGKRNPLQGGRCEGGNAQDETNGSGKLLADNKRWSTVEEAAGQAPSSLDGAAEEAGATFGSDVVVKGDLTGK